MILEGFLDDGTNLENEDVDSATDSDFDQNLRLERALQRRLERMREPQVFHPITPEAEIKTEYPEIEKREELSKPDVTKRAERRRGFDKELRNLIAKRIELNQLPPDAGSPGPPKGMKTRGGVVRPTDFSGRPEKIEPAATDEPESDKKETPEKPVILGDALAARARKMYKKKKTNISVDGQ